MSLADCSQAIEKFIEEVLPRSRNLAQDTRNFLLRLKDMIARKDEEISHIRCELSKQEEVIDEKEGKISDLEFVLEQSEEFFSELGVGIQDILISTSDACLRIKMEAIADYLKTKKLHENDKGQLIFDPIDVGEMIMRADLAV